jgi:acetylornithine deacetylase/succinyl-diaminopimelate desuccinylase-like protein
MFSYRSRLRVLGLLLICVAAVSRAAFAPAAPRQQLANAAGQAPPRQLVVSSEADIRALAERVSVKAALKGLEGQFDQMLRELTTLTEIPAPGFKESARAKWVLERFQHEPGLRNPHIDEEGNVVAEWPGTSTGPTLALAAHLDTVFPEGADLHVKKDGTVWSAPGIGDDTYGVVTLLALIRAMETAQVRTRGTVLFVADVGEEGLSNLRGTRYLFEKSPLRKRIDMFVSIDGVDDSFITNGAVASRRYRVTFKGPGGHSYGAFGIVNPALTMAAAVSRLSRIRVPRRPKTTYNVGLFGGGTSVNSIPSSVWMEVDLRSESPMELRKLELQFLAAVQQAVTDENRLRSTDQGTVTAEARMIGERKGGETPPSSPIVQTAMSVGLYTGKAPGLMSASTDANIPISMGIPAITIGAGARGGRAHSLSEWIDVDRSLALPGLQRVMLLVLALVGVE